MGAVSTKKKSNAGKNVFVFFLVFIILEMLIIFGIGKVFKNKDVTPSILGYSMFMTKEDLYKDSEAGIEVAVPKNVLVIASNGLPDPTNKIGTAVLCEKVPDVGTGVFYLADVSSIEGQDGAVYTISNGAKYYTVKSSNIVGATGSYYKTAGKVISFVTKKFGMIVCAVVPLFLMIFLELIIAIATHSSDDDDDEDDEEEEEERREVQLDDFLFGGQNEGEQIAKQRKQQSASGKKNAVKSNAVDFDDFAPPKKKAAAQQNAAKQAAPANKAQAAPTKQAAAASKAQPAKQVEATTARFEKPNLQAAQTAAQQQEAPVKEAPVSQTPVQQAAPVQEAPVKSESVQQAAPEQKPEAAASTEEAAAAPKPRKRKRLSSASAVGESANASLEELMRLMEEEQNKLKNQMK